MDLQRIRELADAFEASDWDEIDLEIDGVRVHLSTRPTVDESTTRTAAVDGRSARTGAAGRDGTAGPVDESAVRAAELDESPARAAHGDGDGAAGCAVPAGDGGPADVLAQVPPGADGKPVLAPSPGIFWRAPSPGEAPFVEVGDGVQPDTVVCIVELMKLMNRVVAGVSGTVTAVLVDNGGSVDKGGSLLLVDPAGE